MKLYFLVLILSVFCKLFLFITKQDTTQHQSIFLLKPSICYINYILQNFNFFFQVLDAFKTGLCQKQHKQLLVAIERAWDHGYLTYDVPFREYDYSLYNKNTTSV